MEEDPLLGQEPGSYQLGVLHGQVLARLRANDARWEDHIEDSRVLHERVARIERGLNGKTGLGKYRSEVVAGTGLVSVVTLIVLEVLGKL